MHIIVNSIGKATTDWHITALNTYKKRIQSMASLTENCFATPKRHKNSNIDKLKAQEHQALTSTIPHGTYIIAMDERGKQFTTQTYTQTLEKLQTHYQHICFIIGGPDGLSAETRAIAHTSHALSGLTMPHQLAKICLYEQLYRCLTRMHNHPYHR